METDERRPRDSASLGTNLTKTFRVSHVANGSFNKLITWARDLFYRLDEIAMLHREGSGITHSVNMKGRL